MRCLTGDWLTMDLFNRTRPALPSPPKWMQWYVGGKFKRTGDEHLHHLIDLCGLKPDSAVLDVGCGSGRTALPLTSYLSERGRYSGFDPSEKSVRWCQDSITRTYPNFDFTYADLYNGFYNRKGTVHPSEFTFPYADSSFDVAILTSVFTHMLPGDVEHYLREVARVLKPGGRCLGTFFLLNDESEALIAAKRTKFRFKHQRDGYRTTNPFRHEAAVAYPESFIRGLHNECGLGMRDLYPGSWCGRREALSFQDVVIAAKPGRAAT